MGKKQSSNKKVKLNAKLLIAVNVILFSVCAILWFTMMPKTDEADDGKSSAASVETFDECVDAGYDVEESYPRRCTTPDGASYVEELTGPVDFTSDGGVAMEINDFQEGETISSPLTITGRVPGNWSFEADFPVSLIDDDGNVLVETYGALQGDWMTTELVEFESILEFTSPGSGESGTLILRKDNPSGLPEHDDSLEIPVVFE